MKNKKKLYEIEQRLDQLENELNILLQSLNQSFDSKSGALSYEEVIDLWLNGSQQA